MTYLWSGMLITGIIFGILNGNMEAVTEAVLSYSKEAVALCISMAGITGMWTGMMKIAEESGLVKHLSEKLRPFLKFLFPEIPQDSKASEYISFNFLANFFGLSWASTSSGLLAMKELDQLNRKECIQKGTTKKRGVKIASPAMCTFIILNVSSLQLLPMNMLAYRTRYGSPDPAGIVVPAIMATAVSTGAAVLISRFFKKF